MDSVTTHNTPRTSNPLTALLTSGPVILLLRIALGGLFLFSAWDKVQNPDAFAIAIRGYKLLPLELTNVFALLVAWTEIIAGVMLILGVMTRKAAAAIFLLLVMFTVAISSTIVRGIAVDCGCFSNEGGSQTHYTLVIRNLFLIIASLIVVLYDRGFASLGGMFSKKN